MTKNTSKAIEHLKTAWRQTAEDGPDDVNREAMGHIEAAITALKNEPVRGNEPWPMGATAELANAGELAKGL